MHHKEVLVNLPAYSDSTTEMVPESKISWTNVSFVLEMFFIVDGPKIIQYLLLISSIILTGFATENDFFRKSSIWRDMLMYTTAAMLSRVQYKGVRRIRCEMEELRFKHRLILEGHHDCKRGRMGIQDVEMAQEANRELSALSLMLEFNAAWLRFLHLLVICFALASLPGAR
ncbi:hypothetical protein MMC17_003337 [Xylographa soralifera]|nr:hypothetical protein [Xylographa soralifera]